MSLAKNFSYQLAWKLLSLLAPLITTPYVSRVLGVEMVGVYSFTSAVIAYFVLFAMIGIATYGQREIAACVNDRQKRNKIYSEIYFLQLSLSLIALIAYTLFIFLAGSENLVIWIAWFPQIISVSFDISWLYFGVEEFRIPTLRSIFVKICTVLSIFIFIHSPSDVFLYCLINSISILMNQVLLWPFMNKYASFVKPTWKEILSHFRPCLLLFLPVVAVSFYTGLDKIMLGAITGMDAVGYYEYAEKLISMALSVSSALSVVMLPRITKEVAQGNRAEVFDLLAKAFHVAFIFAFFVAFGISAVATDFAILFLGEEYAACGSLMVILAITIPIIAASDIIGRQYLLPMRKDKQFTISIVVGAIINVILNLFLIPSMGALGASISTVCAEVAVLMVQIIITCRQLPLFRYLWSIIPYFCFALLMFCLINISNAYFPPVIGLTWPMLLLKVTLGCFLYFVLAFLWDKVIARAKN